MGRKHFATKPVAHGNEPEHPTSGEPICSQLHRASVRSHEETEEADKKKSSSRC